MTTKTKNTGRAIPTIKSFYSTKAATKTYVKLLLRSSLNTETQERYFDFSTLNMSKYIPEELGATRQTFYTHIRKLSEEGFITQEGERYIFNKDFSYTIIEKEVLEYLLDVANQNVVSVYAALHWRWEFFNGMNKPTYFTQSVLIEDLGMTNQGSSHKAIKSILTSLKLQGLIDFKQQKTNAGNTVLVLTHVSKTVPTVEVEMLEEIIDEPEIQTVAKLHFNSTDF